MDGDDYQGAQLTIKDIPKTTLYLGVITRWIDNTDADNYDIGGIDESWKKSGNVHSNGAGDEVFTVIADIQPIPQFKLTPFWVHHDDVMDYVGSSWDLYGSVTEELTLGLDGNIGSYLENTSDSVSSTDENVTSYWLHGYVKLSSGLFGGGGYFRMPNKVRPGKPNEEQPGNYDDKTVPNSSFEPMKIAEYGGQPDDRTWSINLGYKCPKTDAKVEAIYGRTDIDASGKETDEYNIFVKIPIYKALTFKLYYAYADLEPDNDIQQLGTSILYKF